MSLKNKLNRLKPHISGGKPLASSNQNNMGEQIPFIEKWNEENVFPYFFDNTYCLVREVEYSLSDRHGNYQFADFKEAVEQWNKERSFSHPLSAAGHNADDLFFFDTETTGLGGGTGNTIFLLGHASFQGEKLIVKQHFLPHPGAEVALYQSFLGNVNYTTLVTYNGKAFDWPQVKTRHTLVREHVPKLPLFGHFDLYHAARRMWKHKLERIKLNAVEKEVLGYERKDDIPGYLAPMIYFDFVERKEPEGILGVMKHNEQDILSLITLYTHLTRQLLGTDPDISSKESFEVGRWFSYIGETDKAKETFSSLSESGTEESQAAKLALALEYKRRKEWEKAAELWKAVADGDGNCGQSLLEACIELAKVEEHKRKNAALALVYTERALGLLDSLEPGRKRDRLLGECQKRKGRLIKKTFPGQAHISSI